MKKLVWIILILPVLALADLKRLSAFGFEPSPVDENRVQVQGWDKISAPSGSSYGAYTRNAAGGSPESKALDGMSIYKWDTKSETSLSPKTVIITTAFMSANEKDKSLREIYIYDYDKKFQLEAVSYCLPDLKNCTSVSPKTCAQNKPVDEAVRGAHFRMLSSHYIGVGTALPTAMAEKFNILSPELSRTVCQYYFKKAMTVRPQVQPSSKKSGNQ